MTTDVHTLIAEITAQEERLQFTTFSNADAWALGSRFVEVATERSLGVTINITRGDQQLFHAALPGTTADNDDWIARKIRTVRRYSESSFLVGRRFAASDKDFNTATGLASSEYAAHGGCFPITIRNAGMIGTITVSGLPQADDHALVIEILTEFLGV
jgi:uncharacterized protein (UPF0303 family)